VLVGRTAGVQRGTLPFGVSMFRLASVFAFACLTLAATALLTTPRARALEPEPREKEKDEGPRNRCAALTGKACSTYFHARFSLN
jgi:hypothetical protein